MNDVTSEQDRIESELRQTRSRMDGRLTELRDRMTPGQILDDLTGYLRGSQGADFANNLMATLRNNPVPAVPTAAAAWRRCDTGRGAGRARQSNRALFEYGRRILASCASR